MLLGETWTVEEYISFDLSKAWPEMWEKYIRVNLRLKIVN